MPSFFDRELDIMAVLWETSSATVREVQDRLEPDLAYTTVLTILRKLEAKGCVRHEQEGRAYRYYPLVERRQAERSALRRLLHRLFSGSPEALLTQLVEHDLTAPQLRRLRRQLDQRLREIEGEE